MTYEFEKDPVSGLILVYIVLDEIYEFKMMLDTGALNTTFDINPLYIAKYPIGSRYKIFRIVYHVCICFVAYKVYKEMERVLKQKGVSLSVDKVLSIAKTTTTVKVKLPKSNKYLLKTMILTPKQRMVEPMLCAKYWHM